MLNLCTNNISMEQQIQFIGFTHEEARIFIENIIFDCLRKPALKGEQTNERPLTITEACRILGVSAPTLRKFVNAGKIRRHDLGDRKKVFYRSELEEDIKRIQTQESV